MVSGPNVRTSDEFVPDVIGWDVWGDERWSRVVVAGAVSVMMLVDVVRDDHSVDSVECQ